MKIKRIIIKDLDGKRLYKGSLIGLHYKKEAIASKCLELFNDENPCIIHESYAIESLSEVAEQLLINEKTKRIIISEVLKEKLKDIDLEDYTGMTLELETK